MRIGNREFDIANKTYIMGILNVTPDSFSDGGRWNSLDSALRHTESMIEEGADIIDIGGESTRPGHVTVTTDEEIARIVPIVRAVKKQFDVPVSIDTYKSPVADAALEEGADLVNDIWGFKFDSEMAPVVARYQAACCLMHKKSNRKYNNFMEDMIGEIKECIQKTPNPLGVMVVIEAQHMCMQMRGVEKQNSTTTTSDFTGVFNQMKTREEFISLIR